MKRGKEVKSLGRGLILIVLMLALSLILVHAQQAQAASIKVSCGEDLSGPISGSVRHQFKALDHYIRMINEQGGIDGTKIEFMWTDTQYKVPLDLEFYKRARDQGSVLHFMVGTASGLALAPMASDDKLPIINQAGDHTFLTPKRTMVSSNCPFAYQSSASLKWFLDNWKEKRPPRFAIFGWDNPAIKGPASLLEPWVKKTLTRSDGMKYEWAGKVYVSLRAPDYSTYLLRLKDLKPDMVIIGMDAVDSGSVARDAKRLGLANAFQWIWMTGQNFGVDTLKIAGNEAVEGWMGPSPFESIMADTPGCVKMREVLQKYEGKVYADPNYPLGWVTGVIGVAALKRATKQVGVFELDPQAVLRELLSIKGLDTGGVSAPATLSENKYFALDAIKMWRLKDGKTVMATEWLKVPRFLPEF